MLWAEGLSRKSDVFGAFQRCKAAAENESGTHVRRLRSDNGGKYMSHDFHNFVAEHGIHHDMPSLYCPQANGVAERINRTIVEGLISLLNQAQAPNALWAEALLSFVFVKNRSPHAALAGGVPLAVWRGKPVRVDMLRIWGCRAYHTVTNGRAKLDDKAVPLVFIGYDGDTAAYRLFDPATRKTVRFRDARFVKDEFPFAAATPGTDRAKLAAACACSRRLDQPCLESSSLRCQRCDAADSRACTAGRATSSRTSCSGPRGSRDTAATACLPPRQCPFAASPEPILPDEDSRDELDFLGNDPFGATLAEVEALYSAAGEDLSGMDEQFSLPTSDPRNHREAMRDTDSERWRLGERDEFTSL